MGELDAAAAAAEEQLPEWAKGIFSIRFGGPEVKTAAAAAAPAVTRQQHAAAGEDGAASPPPLPSCYHAVAWLAGEAAAGMEAASDDEVLRTLRRVAALFPRLRLPPGASWDRARLYR